MVHVYQRSRVQVARSFCFGSKDLSNFMIVMHYSMLQSLERLLRTTAAQGRTSVELAMFCCCFTVSPKTSLWQYILCQNATFWKVIGPQNENPAKL